MDFRLGAVIFLCCLGGCARFEHRELSAVEMSASLENRSLDNPALKSFLEKDLRHELATWPQTSWDFETLTLAAFFYHPSLDVARAQWTVAHAGKITAGERPNPTLNITPGYDTTTTTPSPWIPLGSLDVPIETAGKRKRRIAQAERLSEVARLKIASVAWQVRSGVKRALVELNATREMVKLLQAQQELQTQNVRMLEGQREAGAVSVLDVTQAGIAADGARLVLRDAERQQAEALVQLAAAIGVPVKALEGVKFAFAAFSQIQPVASVAEARRQALLNRSDILGALAEYDASESALHLEITRQYPDVHLSPGYQYDQGDNKWTLGITVELPVLNQNKGRIAEAQAKRAEIAARFNALQAGVISDIDRALAGYDAALRKQADADEMVSRLQKQEERARGRFEVGDISKSDLVLQQLQLSTSAQARLEAIIKSQQALVQLEETLQGPLGLPDSVWQVSPRVVESQQAKTH